jgi:hypothetical protein
VRISFFFAVIVFLFAALPKAGAVGTIIYCNVGGSLNGSMKVGVSQGARSSYDAIRKAMDHAYAPLQAPNTTSACITQQIFENFCGAYFILGDFVYSGTGADAAAAATAAMKNCRGAGCAAAIPKPICDGRAAFAESVWGRIQLAVYDIPSIIPNILDLQIPKSNSPIKDAIFLLAYVFFGIFTAQRFPYFSYYKALLAGSLALGAFFVAIFTYQTVGIILTGGTLLREVVPRSTAATADFFHPRPFVIVFIGFSIGHLIGKLLPSKFLDFARLQAWLKQHRRAGPQRIGGEPPIHTAETSPTEQPAAEPSTPAFTTTEEGPSFEPRLLIKRSQRESAIAKKPVFMLDARMEVCTEHRALIRKHGLGTRVVYDSAARQKHMENATSHLDATRDIPGMFAPPAEQTKGVVRSLFKLGRAGVSAAMAGLSLRVTINSLMAGVHVECKDLNELLEAEGAMKEAGTNLKNYLSVSTTFDGSEAVVEL